jgi:hypothetical protein
LKSDKFNDASSNESLLESSELQTSANVVRKDKRTKKHFIMKPNKIQFPPRLGQSVLLYVSEAYFCFAFHINESDKLKGLKFIGILRLSISMEDDDNQYI